MMTVEKIQYLEKWMQMIFLEEKAENERQNTAAAKRTYSYNLLNDPTTQPPDDSLEKVFAFDLESFEELSMKFQAHATQNAAHGNPKNPAPEYLKFSKIFSNENSALNLLENLQIGLNVV
jgi:hypothetical protein